MFGVRSLDPPLNPGWPYPMSSDRINTMFGRLPETVDADSTRGTVAIAVTTTNAVAKKEVNGEALLRTDFMGRSQQD